MGEENPAVVRLPRSFAHSFSQESVMCLPHATNNEHNLSHEVRRPLFVTLDAEGTFPTFAELGVAKCVLGALLSESTLARIRLQVFCLMPDHLHLLFAIRGEHDSLATFLNSFKSYATQLYWKRGQEIAHGTVPLQHAPLQITPSDPQARNQLRQALSEGRVTLRSECVLLKKFPKPSLRDFQRKVLWQESGYDHVIRNEDDFRQTVQYILNNPVERGYVDRPEYYPFSGVLNLQRRPSLAARDLLGTSPLPVGAALCGRPHSFWRGRTRVYRPAQFAAWPRGVR